MKIFINRFWRDYHELELKQATIPIPDNMSLHVRPYHSTTMNAREIKSYLVSSHTVIPMASGDEESQFVIIASDLLQSCNTVV